MVGSIFKLYNVDKSIIISFIVKFHKINVLPKYTCFDGSYASWHNENLVSENGYSWYCIGGSARIITQKDSGRK